jgi:hypothetical protein
MPASRSSCRLAATRTRPTPRTGSERVDRLRDTGCRAARVVGGSPVKNWSPQTPVRADVPRRGAALRLTPTVFWRVSARCTLPTRVTLTRKFDPGAIFHQLESLNWWNWKPDCHMCFQSRKTFVLLKEDNRLPGTSTLSTSASVAMYANVRQI